MPYSHASVIPPVIKHLREHAPTRILDCGCGWGLFGMLFRMHAEVMQGATFHLPQTWRCTVTGVEVFPGYLLPSIHGYVYDHVYTGELLELARNALLPRAQWIYLGDVLEHFSERDGESLLELLFRLTDRSLVVSTPLRLFPQGAEYGNEYERHRSCWDATALGRVVATWGGRLDVLASGPVCLVAALEK